jgi:hypothetical protein
MSARQIIDELPKLTHAERREIARQLFALEEEVQTLADCDRRANEHSLMLDALESEDARDQSR